MDAVQTAWLTRAVLPYLPEKDKKQLFSFNIRSTVIIILHRCSGGILSLEISLTAFLTFSRSTVEIFDQLFVTKGSVVSAFLAT